MRRLVLLLVPSALAVACSSFGDSGDTTPADAAAPAADAGSDGADAATGPEDAGDGGPCDPSAPFGKPVLVTDLSDGANDTVAVRFSDDALTVFFARATPDASFDLFSASRLDRAMPFATPAVLDFVNSPQLDGKPSVTADRNWLYFYRARPVATESDIYVAKRTSNGYEIVSLVPDPVNFGSQNQDPYVSLDGEELFFSSKRDGAPGLWVATGRKADGTYTSAKKLDLGAVPSFVDTPVISADRLTLYFGAGDNTDTAPWVARRASTSDAFGQAEKVAGDLDAAGQRDEPSFITPDGCALYMYSNRGGKFATYRAERSR